MAAFRALLRLTAVAAAIAAHYGIKKADLVDRDAADLPVRLALGEAWVVSETKRELQAGGVDIEVLEASRGIPWRNGCHAV